MSQTRNTILHLSRRFIACPWLTSTLIFAVFSACSACSLFAQSPADEDSGRKADREKKPIVQSAPDKLAPEAALPGRSLPSAPKQAAAEQRQPEAQEAPAAAGAENDIFIKNGDLTAIVQIFSKKTGRNYILDERIKGKVSIYLPGKASDDEAIRILDAVLALKGFSAVPIGENIWKILPSKDARQSTIPTRDDGEEVTAPSATMVTKLLSLKYMAANEAREILAPLVTGDGLINAYGGTNSLIIIDAEDNIARLINIIEALDVPYSDRFMIIIPVKYADAVDIASKLADILGLDGSDSSGSNKPGSTNALDMLRTRMLDQAGQQTGQPAGMNKQGQQSGQSAGGSAASSATGVRSREPKILADERTNSIIVVADDDTTARVRALVSQLDSEQNLGGKRFWVYRCKYAVADDLAQVLSGLGEGGSTGGSARTNSSAFFGGPGSRDSESDSGFGSNSRNSSFGKSSGSSRTQDRLSRQQRTPGQSRLGNSGNRGITGSVSLGENISISADPSTNSLLINAAKDDYLKLLELLKDLDIRRRQVLVEAMLLEVGVDDSTVLSTSFLTSAGGADGGVMAKNDFKGNLTSLFSDPTKLSQFSVAAASSGTLTLPGDIKIPTQSILMTAAKANSNVNVLSAPTILATDNEQAEIVVGQNVPFLASTSTSGDNLNNTFNQIDRQDVGITLRLTPQISSEDTVRLQIFTEVSNVVAATMASALGPTTTVRTSETSVITRDGQMIVIGGLMSDDVTQSEDGVPYFQDIPILGHLFKGNSENRKRTNLLIFITPRVVKDQFDAREATVAKRDRMESDIDTDGMFPERADILRREEIDSVTEVEPPVKREMGTILPPADSEIESTGTIGSHSTAAPQGLSRSSDGALEIKISPKFANITDEPRASLGRKASDSSSAGTAPATRYVLLQLVKTDADTESLPFSLSEGQKLALIALPPDGPLQAREFFASGRSFSYQLEDSASAGPMATFQVLGLMNNPDEAAAYGGDKLPEPYMLSPYEVMNLGTGPWVAARRGSEKHAKQGTGSALLAD